MNEPRYDRLVTKICDDIRDLHRLVCLADALRSAQRDYMSDRGNESKGRAVAMAAAAYDAVREKVSV